MEQRQKLRTQQSKSLSIKRLANATLSASSIAVHASLPLVYSRWGFSHKTAYSMAFFTIATPLMFVSIDKYTSPSNSYDKNWKILKKNDYSDSRIYSYLLINGVIIQIGTFLGAYKGIGYKPKFDYKLPLIFLTNLTVAEILFYTIHKTLHKTKSMAHLHLLHHCLKYPGMFANVIFNPIDTILEFCPVMIAVLSTHILWHQHKFATTLSTGLLIAWYFSDHDEFMRLPHTKHHLAINGIYTIYSAVDSGTKGEFVREIMKK